MMKRITILLFCIFALLSCAKEQGAFKTEGTPYFSIVVQDGGALPVAKLDPMSAQYTLEMTANGYSSADNATKHVTKALRFHVSSNLRWKILPADGKGADWVHPFPASGEKEGIFFFKADRNIDPDNDREVLYNILVDDGSGVYEPLEGMLRVRQAKSDHFLEMSAARFNATNLAQKVTLRVTANVNWKYSLSPMPDYATENLDWLADTLTFPHPIEQQIDTLSFQLAENTGGIRGANLAITYSLDGINNITDVIPIVQFPASEAVLDGFPVKWVVRVADQNTFSATFPSNGTVPPVSGPGMITFHNEAGKAADTGNNVKLDVSDNSPRATGVWPGDYCEFVASSPVSVGTVVKLSFATRVSSAGMRYWRLEYRDGQTWKIAGKSYTDPSVLAPDGKPAIFTHMMNTDGNSNILVDAVVTYTENTDQVEFRFICASSVRCSGGQPSAPTTATWRLSTDSDSAQDEYQPCISIVAAGAEPPARANLSVTPAFLSFEASNAGSKDFLVTCDQAFSINPEQSWIHVSSLQEYGGENIKITVTCDDNVLKRIREGSITVVAGITRYQVGIIQAGSGGGGGDTPVVPTQASFPIVWSMPAPSATWVSGTDFSMVSKGQSGSYVYSDTHSGKLSVVRPAGTDTSNPTYLSKTDVSGYENEYMFLHYGMNEGAYWLFEVYNVKNPAGTYGISYVTTASAAGPKCFTLEYSTDGNNWTPINTTTTTIEKKDGTEYGEVTYTYMIAPLTNAANEPCLVNESFHLDALTTATTLRIRARVSAKIRVSRESDMTAPTTGGTNRMFHTPKITFTAD
ncbi:MAG: BACON domain-containing protein [Bacteroidales bacterium]|nr:BACON domain-containing protein [Bacteroidales bacterium]